MPEVAKRMRLIDDNRQMISVYLGRILQNEKGEKIDGRVLWQEYKGLIEECKLEYAKKDKAARYSKPDEWIYISI